MTVPRIGLGYDVHRFGDERRLMLGGVEIPGAQGLDGHSDADVLLHAIMDALLGAAGLPDIGHHFPNTDPSLRDVSSLVLLAKVRGLITTEGYAIGNIDATLLAEAPKIAPFIVAMRGAIAEALDILPTAIGIKATTHEQLGCFGRGEGMAAMAVAMVFS
jgi:2-C-methyl-D-erythritol 2,4-cyclodiphosphate synthase